MIVLIPFFFLIFFSQNTQAAINFDKSSTIVVKEGTTLNLLQPMAVTSGKIIIEPGAVVSGTLNNDIAFSSASLVDRVATNEQIDGSFLREFDSTVPTDTLSLSDGQNFSTNAQVLSNVFVSGTGNSIVGSPKFTKPITLVTSPQSSLSMGVFTNCDVSIELAGGALNLTQNLKLSPGATITSSTGAASISLGDQTLSIAGASGGWSENLAISGPGTINIVSDLSLLGAWTLSGNTTITSQGSALDLSNSNAQLIIGTNTTLELDNLNLNGLQNGKIVFTDPTSTLKITNSNVELAGDYDQTLGALVTENSTIVTSTNYWKLGPDATFSNIDGVLWLDTLGSIQPPEFGQTTTAGFESLVNNSNVKQKVDFQKVSDAINRFLVSGNVNASVALSTSTVVNPGQAIVATDNATITSSGAAISFTPSGSPQLVVNSGKQLTLAGTHTLNIQSNTIGIQPGATLAVNGSTTINAQDDVSIPSGTIAVQGQSTMVINGSANGNTKFGLSSVPGEPPAALNIGIGSVELKGIDLYNVGQASVSSKIINGAVVQGQMILGGGATVHISENCHMNFLVRGENNTLVMQNSGLTLFGTIKFETYDTNELYIKFDLASEDDPMTMSFGNGSMQLFSGTGFAKLTFQDRDVTITNLGINSFLTGGHAFLAGYYLTISGNPIVQSVSDLGLGTTLFLENDSSISNPFIVKSFKDIVRSRGREFCKTFKFDTQNKYENYFKSKAVMSRTPSASLPTLRITNVVTGIAQGVVRLYINSTLGKFAGSDSLNSLELQFTGNGSVTSVPRRQARTVPPGKPTVQDFQDSTYTDSLKPKDKVFVSGTANQFTVTGNLDFSSQLYLDAGAELIFQFDDSLNTPKAILFRPVDQNGKPYLYLPQSSSIIFSGSGQVIFDPYLQIEFGGDPLTITVPGTNVSADDRPSFIFKNYAQMFLDQGQQLSFFGKGKLFLQSNGKLNLVSGLITVGSSSSDSFDMTFDRQSSLVLGATTYAGNSTAAIASSPARLSLAYGAFTIQFSKQSELLIQNGGIFELTLQNGVYTSGQITELAFTEQSTMNLQGFGRLAIAQPTNDLVGSTIYNFYFNNLDSTFAGSGLLTFYTSASSTTPLFEGQMQSGRAFLSQSASPYYFFTELLRVTKLKSEIIPNPNQLGLILAVDYTDINGTYQLRNANGVTVPLLAGDAIRREAPQGGANAGTVFGSSAVGVNFAILPDGTRQNG